jgi:hypothetical protein
MKRLPLILLLVLATALVAATPATNGLMSRLAAYDADSADPITTVPVDIAAIRRAAGLVPDEASYALVVNGDGQLQHDVDGVVRLHFMPSLPVTDRAEADWLLVYGGGAPPAGSSVAERVRVGELVDLYRLR